MANTQQTIAFPLIPSQLSSCTQQVKQHMLTKNNLPQINQTRIQHRDVYKHVAAFLDAATPVHNVTDQQYMLLQEI